MTFTTRTPVLKKQTKKKKEIKSNNNQNCRSMEKKTLDSLSVYFFSYLWTRSILETTIFTLYTGEIDDINLL